MLHLHRAERADLLADALGELLREPDGDPFAAELIAVPAKGVERWLTQRLSHVLGGTPGGEDGVCAGVEFLSPAALISRAVPVRDDPWEPGSLTWAVLAVIDANLAEPWCAGLAAHLHGRPSEPLLNGRGAGSRRGRRWAAAAHLTELFVAYGASRPDMLRAWAAGEDTEDGHGSPLPDDLRWQAELWRRLREQIGCPSPAERLTAACVALRTEPGAVNLPARLSLFGATRLTTEQRAVLTALASGREVHLWLPHPSPALWDAVGAPRVPKDVAALRRLDRSRGLARHPLLASMARDVRELQALLAGVADEDRHHAAESSPPRATTLLGQLQADLAADAPPAGRLQLALDDRSIAVQSCHGPARQVEVLREALLGLFADDPTLQPRDVLVMCPDVETYAPLVSAAFGLSGETESPDGVPTAAASHPGHRLRVRLADRSLRQTNPLLDVVARLLELADGRVTASDVLDVAATPGVRRRFGFDDEELERLRGWVADSGVRWGLDGQHRAAWHLQALGQNTWRTGLDRILLGVTAAEDDLPWLELALPLDDVDSGDVDLAGRLAELLDRLDTVLGRLTASAPACSWAATLSGALDLLTDVSERDGWQLAQARREVAAGVGDAQLELGDVRAMLAGRLRGRPTRANFRTGSLTVCTMVPMRSVPHRVIALLGLDDGTFPRVLAVDGDDVLLREPRVGERDRRSEDRQLLLDAVMAAREHLLVFYTGADPLTGARRPPSVPIGELLDVLDTTAVTADGSDVRRTVLLEQPLQPFDRRNFQPGQLGRSGPFSFDRGNLAGAVRAARPRDPARPFLDRALAPRPGPVELADLVAFMEHPVKAFMKLRLQVAVTGDDEQVTDDMSIELEPLAGWDVGERMLLARLGGTDTASFRQAELRRGTLPPGPIGLRILSGLEQQVEMLAAATERSGPVRVVDVQVDLGGRLLAGTVPGVYGETVVRTTYSRLAPKHRLRAWVQLLALCAGQPDTWKMRTTGRGVGVQVSTRLLSAVPAAVATDLLGRLVALYDRGMRAPLPLDPAAAHAYARQRFSGGSAELARDAALKSWDDKFGAIADRHHGLAWGDRPAFSTVLADCPDFDELAWDIWEPLLVVEQ